MAWTVRLDFGDTTGWRDITDKVDKTSFKRTQTLWNELRPTVDSLRFEMLWDSTIIGLLLTQDSTDVKINVQEDAVDYFTGYVRTNWDFSLKTRPAAMKIECVDPGILLRDKRIEPATPALWEDYTIYNAGDSSASILSKLMIGAGFTHADIVGDTIGDTIDFYPYVRDGRTYWEAIEAILYDFHRTPFFNGSGKLDWVDWSPSSISIGDTFDNANMVGELRLKKLPEKYQAVGVAYFSHKTITDALVFSDTTNGNQTHKCSITLAASEYYPEGGDSRDVYADYRVEGENLIAVKNASVDKIIGDSVVEDDFTSYYTKALIRYHNAGASAEYIYKLDIRGDAIVQDSLNVKRRDFVSGTDRKLDYQSPYLYTALPAERLVRALASYYRYADFSYTLRSGDSVALGTYVTISETSWLNISNTAIVTERVDNELTGEQTYKLEGMAAYNAGDTVSDDDGGVLTPFPNQSRDYIVVGSSTYAGDADYYCDGDSDEVEINTAITFAATNNIGTVHLVGGIFSTSDAIDIAEGITLDLNGSEIQKNGASHGIAGTNTNSWGVRDGKITQGDTNTGYSLIAAGGTASNVRITNVNFTFTKHTAVGFGNGTNRELSSCSFTGTDVWLTGGNSPPAVSAATDSGAYSLRINNNYFNKCIVYNDGGPIEIVNNTFVGAFEPGILLANSDNAYVANNKIIGCGYDYFSAGQPRAGVVIDSDTSDAQVVGNHTYDNGNMILDSRCNITINPPRIDGNLLTDTGDTRSSDQAYRGTYSYKIDKTNAAGTAAYYYFTDNASTADRHGLNQVTTYRASVWVYVPSTGGPAAAEVTLRVGQYDGSWTFYTDSATTQDAWEQLTVDLPVNASAAGCVMNVQFESTAASGEYFYIDDVRLYVPGLNNTHDLNFNDGGTDTVIYGNSWQ